MVRRRVCLRLLAQAALWRTLLAITCPKGWKLIRDRCFHLSSTEHTFESCQQDVCGPMGSTLACLQPDDSYPLAYKFGIGYSDDLFAAWIGYTSAGGEWEWINGCKKSWSHWVTGEPNNFCGGENCAAINGVSGGWMDLSCRMRFPCLCEYPGTLIATYNRTISGMRDDTCYAGCGGVTKWCSAWPFVRLYDVDDDLCHWETADGQRRGKGVSECAKHVAAREDCGPYFAYSVGDCRCSPKKGVHVNCTHREGDANSDVFFLSKMGTELVHTGQRCINAKPVDTEFFASIRPAYTPAGFLRLWARAAFIWLIFGIPCGFLIFCVLLRMFVSCGVVDQLEADPFGGKDGVAPAGGAYGQLIDGSDPDSAEAVNRWIFRAAFGAIIYGLSQLSLGVTLSMHLSGSEQVASLEALEMLLAIVMAFSKAAVTRAACMVHCRMTPVARQIAGPWILVYAFAKSLGAVSAVGSILIFSALAHRDFEIICLAIYLFRWSLLLALPLECLAGFSIWRTQLRAEPYGANEVQVGGWVTSLVAGNFGAGTAVWWAGYLGAVHESDIAMGGCFILAALSQLLAGVSMVLVNRKIKQYFGQETQTQSDVVAPTEYGRS